MTIPFGPDDVMADLVETDADRAFQPQPDCCEDCDEEIAFAGIVAPLVAEGVSG